MKNIPIMTVKNINMAYGTKVILEDINFSVFQGEFVVILGKNGEGKTTLLEIIDKLQKPTTGEVNIRGLSPKINISEKVGLSPQKHSQIWDFEVRDIIEMGFYTKKATINHEKKINELLKLFKIENLSRRLFSTLSGGEQQKVIIARSIAQEPQILLLDEPITFLDLKQQIQILELLSGLVKKGLCIIAVLHDLQLTANYADRVILLKNHKVFLDDSVKKALTEQNLQTVFEVPIKINQTTNGLQIIYPEKGTILD